MNQEKRSLLFLPRTTRNKHMNTFRVT